MDLRVSPGIARGSVILPASKSISHRALIAAALARGKSKISSLTLSDDINATIASLRALGADIRYDNNTCTATVDGGLTYPQNAILPCSDSASTLRFLLPVALLSDKQMRFTRSNGLKSRPLHTYTDVFSHQSISIIEQDNDVIVQGPLQPGKYAADCSVSSQYISGLLFALPLLKRESRILPTTPVVSKPYIDLTKIMLHSAHIDIEEDNTGYYIPGNQCYQPFDLLPEPDVTAAAYIELLNTLGGKVEFLNANNCSAQGDTVYQSYYKILQQENATLDVCQCPDLAPALMVVSAFHHGGCLRGTGRLRFKESNRGHVMANELRKLGATVYVDGEVIRIEPISEFHKDVILDSHGDHRIAMALAAAVTVCGGVIRHAEAVAKSYPDFWQHYRNLGICCDLMHGEQQFSYNP